MIATIWMVGTVGMMLIEISTDLDSHANQCVLRNNTLVVMIMRNLLISLGTIPMDQFLKSSTWSQEHWHMIALIIVRLSFWLSTRQFTIQNWPTICWVWFRCGLMTWRLTIKQNSSQASPLSVIMQFVW
jgi:hypothetical protein